MENILPKIHEALSKAKTETHSNNIVYQIKHRNPIVKQELKQYFQQGDISKEHTVVEVDFIKEPEKVSRKQRRKWKMEKIIESLTRSCPDSADVEGPGGVEDVEGVEGLSSSTRADHENFEECPEAPPRKEAEELNMPNIKIYNSPIYICGRYIKLSRNMTQSPLLINGQLKTPRSVSDFTREFERFYLADAVKFMAAGREDIDVRCLGGRPFILEVQLPKRNIHADVMNIQLHNDIDLVDTFIAHKSCKGIINSDESVKFYSLVIFSERKIKFQESYNLEQKTPLRVLHRRANMLRNKTIGILSCTEHARDDGYYYQLSIEASSGTYIKEWVNGDFGRTQPNLNADLLTLDVTGVNKSFDEKLKLSELKLNKTFY